MKIINFLKISLILLLNHNLILPESAEFEVGFKESMGQIINESGYKLKFDFELISKIINDKVIKTTYTKVLAPNERFLIWDFLKINSINYETYGDIKGKIFTGQYTIDVKNIKKELLEKMKGTKNILNPIITIKSQGTKYTDSVKYPNSIDLLGAEGRKAMKDNKPLNVFLAATAKGEAYKPKNILGVPDDATSGSVEYAFYEIKLKWDPSNFYFKNETEKKFANEVLKIARKAFKDLGGKESTSFPKVDAALSKGQEPTPWDYLGIDKNATQEQVDQAYKTLKRKFTELTKSKNSGIAKQADDDLMAVENAYTNLLIEKSTELSKSIKS